MNTFEAKASETVGLPSYMAFKKKRHVLIARLVYLLSFIQFLDISGIKIA